VQRGRDTNRQPGDRRRRSFTYERRDDLAVPGTEREANPDFTCPLLYVVRDQRRNASYPAIR
jgi:hypothetical protein